MILFARKSRQLRGFREMTENLDNAIHGVQEARTAIMVETGDAETIEEEDALEVIQRMLNEVEEKIKVYGK